MTQRKRVPKCFKPDSSEPFSEYDLHIECVKYCRSRNLLINHCHNEYVLGDSKYKQINKAKSMGFSTGYPDLNVFLANGITLFFEFKKGKNGLGDKQIEWRRKLIARGHRWYLIKDFESFKKIIEGYLDGKKN